MSKDEFIKRIEKAGFKQSGETTNYYNTIDEYTYNLFIVKNMDLFIHMGTAYSFDELDKFLIDKKIIEKTFDAHGYLVEKGFFWDGYDYLTKTYSLKYIKDRAKIGIYIFNLEPSHIYIENYQQMDFKKLIDSAITIANTLLTVELESDHESK